MHRHRRRIVRVPAPLALVSLAALLGPAGAARAQCLNPNLPTSSSTRALAMGDANVAGRDDDVIFYGPAQLAIARGTSVAAERYADHVASAAVASTARIASGGVGIGVTLATARNGSNCTMIEFGPTGPFFVPAPENFTRAVVAVGVAQTYKRFRVGVTGKYASRQLGDDRASNLLADVGVARDLGLADGVSIGIALAVQNLGPSIADALTLQLPPRALVGASTVVAAGPLDLGLAAQIGAEKHSNRSILRAGRVTAGAGAEVGYSWLEGYSVALRAGSRTASEFSDLRHFTAGAGIIVDRIAIDYALETLAGAQLAHRIGVRLR